MKAQTPAKGYPSCCLQVSELVFWHSRCYFPGKTNKVVLADRRKEKSRQHPLQAAALKLVILQERYVTARPRPTRLERWNNDADGNE